MRDSVYENITKIKVCYNYVITEELGSVLRSLE